MLIYFKHEVYFGLLFGILSILVNNILVNNQPLMFTTSTLALPNPKRLHMEALSFSTFSKMWYLSLWLVKIQHWVKHYYWKLKKCYLVSTKGHTQKENFWYKAESCRERNILWHKCKHLSQTYTYRTHTGVQIFLLWAQV